ncbi:glycosyl transferase [Bacillus sp. EAC]|uniref:glycosyl transferase n=1 Tax=Bacillus sp. EAC TaxID=1978338 RepID=UPI000B454F23|nr:glycosyl transferase [Bacillus sp. EAC]
MGNQMKFFLLGILFVLMSTPLGYITVNMFYYNNKQSSDYIHLLNGFIHSYMLIGALIFSIGLLHTLRNK